MSNQDLNNEEPNDFRAVWLRELLQLSAARSSQIRKNSNSSLRGFCQDVNRTKCGEFGKMLNIKM